MEGFCAMFSCSWVNIALFYDFIKPIIQFPFGNYCTLLYKVEFICIGIFRIGFGGHEVIHKIGLPLEYEYEILKLEGEIERQEYILNFLDDTIPVLRQAERAKQIIKMNGHFRYFDPISFK